MNTTSSGQIRVIVYFGAAGFLIAVALGAVWYFINSRSFDPNLVLRLQDFTLVVWPSSIMLMGVQHPGWAVSTTAIVMSAAANAFLYGLLGFAIAAVYTKLHGADRPK